MRIEVEGIYPGLGTASLIRTLAWILVDMERDVLVFSEAENLDRKFCEKPSGAADRYLLDLTRGEKDAIAPDYAFQLHPRLSILESSNLLSREERAGLQEELMDESGSVLLAGNFSGKPARRFMVIPSDPSWLQQDKGRLYELSIDHLFISHMSQENRCQDIYEAYGELLRKPFTILPTCSALQREWLEPLDLQGLLGSDYGRVVRGVVEDQLYPEQVQEGNAVYRVLRRFRRSWNGR